MPRDILEIFRTAQFAVSHVNKILPADYFPEFLQVVLMDGVVGPVAAHYLMINRDCAVR